jgi:hypothetical protein
MIGGLNYEAIKEISEARIIGEKVEWEKIPYTSGNDTIKGRQCHTSVPYQNKIYSFGGCFMWSNKRQVRECTNQVIVFDIAEQHVNILKTKGFSVIPRKNHCASMYLKSMVVYGG